MLQWMGGARRKMKAARNEKLKRQQEYFDHRKEKQRKMELGEESGKVHTLADYINQNLHGGESLDILGLRSLNPSPVVDVNTAADSDASLPDPTTVALKPNLGDFGTVTPATSNGSAYSAGNIKGNAQDISLQQPECKTNSRGIGREPEQEIKSRRPCAQRTSRVAASAQQCIEKLVNRNMEIPLPGKRRNPIHVGNLQTKKVASTPRLKLLDIISDENKDENRGKKRLPSESYAIFSQDGNDAMFDQGALHPQETSLDSDSVADWGGTKQLQSSSLQLKNSFNSCNETLVTGTTNLLSKFLSTQKLKSFKGQSSRQPLQHKVTEDNRLGTESIVNSLRITHNGGHDLYFSDPTFNTTKSKAKVPRKMSFSESLLDMEYFHVKQGPQNFDISDSFVDTMSNQVKQDRQEYRYLNPSFNIYDHQVTHDYPFLHDLSFDWSSFKVDSNFFDPEETSYSPGNDSITWNNDISLTLPNFKREFRNLDHFWPIQVPSCDRSQYSSRQFGTCDKFPDMIEDFCPSLEYRQISDVKFDKLLLPMDGFEVERQHVEADFSSRDDFSSRRRRTNRRNFEKETLDGNDDRREKFAFSEEYKCDLSATWDVPWHQDQYSSAHSGGDSDQTHNLNGSNSWSQTVDGGTADRFSDYLDSDMDVMQGGFLPSEMQATSAPETFQDLKPLLLPPINNGDEDFIIVCFSDNEDCPTVDANSLQLPILPTSFPLLELGTEKSSSGMDHDIHTLSYETHFNRISQETDDFRVSRKDITSVEATTSTHKKLTSARESPTCDRILTSSHQSQLDYPPLPYSASSFGTGTELMAWHSREPQREACSELQSFPKTRRSFSNFLAKDGETIEGGLEPHIYSNDSVDQCLSSNDLYNHASRHEMTHNIEENSVQVCTSMRKPLQDDLNGMSTTEAERMPRKQLWVDHGVAHDTGFRASFSIQEECSPASQLNTVQSVLCKLQKPASSDQGIKNVDNVLLKLQRPTRHSIHGLGHQDAEANWTVKRTSEMNQTSSIESEIKTTAECRARLLTHNKTPGSRGSFPLPNASKTICLYSKEGEDKRGLSEISTLRNKESKLSLKDIDAIASTDNRFSNQPYQRSSQSKAHSLPSLVRIKEVADSSVPRAGNAKPYSTPVSQRNPVSEVPDREQPSRRDSDPQVSYTGGLQSSSNTPQASERQKIMKASEEQEEFQNIQHNLPITEFKLFQVGRSPTTSYDAAYMKMPEGLQNNQQNLPDSEKHNTQGRRPTSTSCDADYVKMLESYVVQLKLENNTLRLWTGS